MSKTRVASDELRMTLAEPYLRLYHRTVGAHVHCNLFAGIGKVGELTFSLEEWPLCHALLGRGVWVEAER